MFSNVTLLNLIGSIFAASDAEFPQATRRISNYCIRLEIRRPAAGRPLPQRSELATRRLASMRIVENRNGPNRFEYPLPRVSACAHPIFFDGVLRLGVMVSVDGPGVRNSDNYAFGLGGGLS